MLKLKKEHASEQVPYRLEVGADIVASTMDPEIAQELVSHAELSKGIEGFGLRTSEGLMFPEDWFVDDGVPAPKEKPTSKKNKGELLDEVEQELTNEEMREAIGKAKESPEKPRPRKA